MCLLSSTCAKVLCAINGANVTQPALSTASSAAGSTSLQARPGGAIDTTGLNRTRACYLALQLTSSESKASRCGCVVAERATTAGRPCATHAGSSSPLAAQPTAHAQPGWVWGQGDAYPHTCTCTLSLAAYGLSSTAEVPFYVEPVISRPVITSNVSARGNLTAGAWCGEVVGAAWLRRQTIQKGLRRLAPPSVQCGNPTRSPDTSHHHTSLQRRLQLSSEGTICAVAPCTYGG